MSRYGMQERTEYKDSQ